MSVAGDKSNRDQGPGERLWDADIRYYDDIVDA